jgi:hypothetical protein
MIIRNMSKRPTYNLPGLPIWFKIVAGALASAALIGFLYLVWPRSTPGGTLDAYISALSSKRCGKAYDLVSYYIRKNNSDYSTYDDFNRTVCTPVVQKYTYLDLHKVEDTIINGNEASVLARLKFQAPWMPETQYRTMEFVLVKEGRQWMLEGPQLQP